MSSSWYIKEHMVLCESFLIDIPKVKQLSEITAANSHSEEYPTFLKFALFAGLVIYIPFHSSLPVSISKGDNGSLRVKLFE